MKPYLETHQNSSKKTNIYQILSTKSHANPATIVYLGDTHNDIDALTLYPSAPLDSEAHRSKFLSGVLYCLKFLLHDIKEHCEVDLGVAWRYDKRILFNIASVAYTDGPGGIKVVPNKVNAAYQSMILLRFAHEQAKGAR